MLAQLVILVVFITVVNGCTNLLVSKGASKEATNTISYNADASNFYTTIYHYPAAVNSNETMRKVWSWDYGTYLGEIPEASETFNVAGNVNEWGLIITESTFGGLSELACTKKNGIIDYGSLEYITLQRTKTAREAIMKMGELVAAYGYASTGESFSIADQNELWYMELIGKGNYEKGAVWVARKVPDGFVTGHANQARITTFPLDDSENTLYSSDVISFAKKIGLFEGDDAAFSFSDTYDPVTFSGARSCEARVWSFFSTVMGQEWSDQYLDYVQGKNLKNRMPLWVKPDNKISLADVMQSMRSHYEGTALDTTGLLMKDVGAGSSNSPLRTGPSTWTAPSYKGNKYVNERHIAGGFSGWSIVCQSRPNMPQELAALMWYGIDDSSTTVHFPVYGSITRIPDGWSGPGPQDGATPPMMTFDPRNPSAFYAFNLVANYAYTRWSEIYPDVLKTVLAKEAEYLQMSAETDAKAATIYATEGRSAAIEYLTSFSNKVGVKLLDDWVSFFGQLFVKYRDGYVTTAAPAVPVCGCSTSSVSYPSAWYDRIADETGDHYLVPSSTSQKRSTIPKHELRSFN